MYVRAYLGVPYGATQPQLSKTNNHTHMRKAEDINPNNLLEATQ